MEWKEGALVAANITSGNGGTCYVRSSVPLATKDGELSESGIPRKREIEFGRNRIRWESAAEQELETLYLPGTYDYELVTSAGETYRLTGQTIKKQK